MTNKVDYIDLPYPDFKYKAIIDSEQFDLNNAEIKKKVNDALAVLNQVLKGIADTTNLTTASGTELIGAKNTFGVTDSVGAVAKNLDTFLRDLVNTLNSSTVAKPGAKFIGAAKPSGLISTNVQGLLEELKNYIDAHWLEIDATKTNVVNLTNRVAATEAVDGSQTIRLNNIESKNTTQDSRLTTIEGVNSTQDTRLSALETKNTAVDAQLRGIETLNNTQDSRLHGIDLILDRFFWSGEDPNCITTTSIYDDGYGIRLDEVVDALYNRSSVSANMFVLNSPPTSGYHTTGEIVWTGKPTPGGKVGWVCTTSGNPGTWKAFGAIDA